MLSVVVMVLAMVAAGSWGRTMDRGKNDVEVLVGGLRGPMLLPLTGFDGPSLNDINIDLADKPDLDPVLIMDADVAAPENDLELLEEEYDDLDEALAEAEELEEVMRMMEDEELDEGLEGEVEELEEELEEEEVLEEELEEEVLDEGIGDVVVVEVATAEEEVGDTEDEVEDAAEEDLDEIFKAEDDVVVVMRRMYEEITNRLTSLESRVSHVEETSGDVVSRLTVVDCSDLAGQGKKGSWPYTFHMDHHGKRPVTVMCDMDTDGGGWTVIQQRPSASDAVDFARDWHDYKLGFGAVNTDYWIGLENIFIWTNTRRYEMRIDLTDFEGDTAHAHYQEFYIDGEDQAYRVHVSGYSGTTGDALTQDGAPDNFTADGMMFSTHDNDHDLSREINCSKFWGIGGWWFNRCSWANLNGPFREPGTGDGIGFNWHTWRNKQYLRTSTMMIRPTSTP